MGVILRDRFDVTVPVLLFSSLLSQISDLRSLLLGRHRSVRAPRPRECLGVVLRIDLGSQEWNLGCHVHGALNILHDLELVARLLLQLKRCVIERTSHGTLLSNRFASLRKRLESSGRTWTEIALTSLESSDSCYRCFGSILPEELIVGHRRVIESVMVVLGAVEELTIRWVQLVIVLGAFDIEVADPAQLPIDVSLLRKLGIVWHPGSLDFVLIVGVQLPLRVVHDVILVTIVFPKVLL